MSKITVLVLFGGESPEHEVSITSAGNVVAALDSRKFTILLCYIDKQGRWWQVESLDDTAGGRQLLPKLGDKAFVTVKGKELKPDVVFPVLHGANGEDGTVQGLLSLLHIPYVGCNVVASAICMDKHVTKQLLQAAGMPVVPYVTHNIVDSVPSYTEVAARLGQILFVKPAHTGSSVGVSKVQAEEEFASALETAHNLDELVLIEQAINAREIEVAVLGNHNLKIASLGEVIPDREFFDYDSKYDSASQSETVIPANLSESLQEQISKIAAQAYKTIGCTGLARVDFLVDKQSLEVYLNEINTLPGFTGTSMYPQLWQAEGMTYAELIEELLSLALEKPV